MSLRTSRQRAYLDALGIDHYVPRAAPESPGLTETSGAEALETMQNAEATSPEITAWDALPAAIESCRRCELGHSRTQSVFGRGNHRADWLVIGEAPGAEEDRQGLPFVGRAGHLLDGMLRAIGLTEETVFIANVLKCRPPNNRDPSAGEIAACRRYLDAQVAHVQPKVILIVGRIAAQTLLESKAPVGRLRGRRHDVDGLTAPVVVTYHPAYLLRSPAQKAKAWDDLKLALSIAEMAS